MNVGLTFRQALALYRVVQSMNLVHAQISTSREDLLDPEEMHDLQHRLDYALHNHAGGKE
jgi:hypothetical protein